MILGQRASCKSALNQHRDNARYNRGRDGDYNEYERVVRTQAIFFLLLCFRLD